MSLAAFHATMRGGDDSPEVCAARGAWHLDLIEPTWFSRKKHRNHDRISIKRLDMSDGKYCIVGQLYDYYIVGKEMVVPNRVCQNRLARRLGLILPPTGGNHPDPIIARLNAAWRNEIRWRRRTYPEV